MNYRRQIKGSSEGPSLPFFFPPHFLFYLQAVTDIHFNFFMFYIITFLF